MKNIFKGIGAFLNKKVVVKNYGMIKPAIYNEINISQIKDIMRVKDWNRTIRLFETMIKRDSRISGDLGERKSKILSANFSIESDNKELNNFITAYFEKINYLELVADINSSLDFGFSVVDMEWNHFTHNNKKYFVPLKFNHISQMQISQDDTTEEYYFTDDNYQRHILDDENYKFIYHLHKLDAGGILDFSSLSKLIWIFTIKHFIMGQYMSFTELLGVPPVIVNSEAKDEETISNMMDQVFQLRSGSAGVFGATDKVSLVEGKANGDLFLKFIQYADAEISHIILGGSVSNGNSANGSNARDKEHNKIKQTYFKADCNLISQTINNLIIKICELNFNNIKEYPKFKLFIKEEVNTKDEVATLKVLKDLGVPLSVSHIQNKFNLPLSIEENDILDNNLNNKKIDNNTMKNNHIENNKKNNQPKLLDNIDLQLNQIDTKDEEIEIATSIISILDEADSYEEAIELIHKNFNNINTNKLDKLINNLIFNATISGNIND